MHISLLYVLELQQERSFCTPPMTDHTGETMVQGSPSRRALIDLRAVRNAAKTASIAAGTISSAIAQEVLEAGATKDLVQSPRA